MQHSPYSLNECSIESFGDTIVFWCVVHGEFLFCSITFQMTRELIGQILSSMIRTKALDSCTMLSLQPGLVLQVSRECVRFCEHQVNASIAGMIISERAVIAALSRCLDRGWTPDIGMYFVAKHCRTIGFTDVPDRLSNCFPVLTGYALTHVTVVWM